MADNRKPHRIRAKMKDNVTVVKILIRHPIETGRRKDNVTGEKIPRHFIREIRCEHNGEPVLTADWSWGVSRNPYLSFRILDAKPGDNVRIEWIDNHGEDETLETIVN